MPREWLLHPELFAPVPGGLYSAGIHPWWTEEAEVLPQLFDGLKALLPHPVIVALGECGLDRLKGAEMQVQEEIFCRQVELAELHQLPITIHCVRAFDRLLYLHKKLRPSTRWTIHGFRGNPTLARQLLIAGLDLSFGKRYNADSFALTPPDRRHLESDDDFVE